MDLGRRGLPDDSPGMVPESDLRDLSGRQPEDNTYVLARRARFLIALFFMILVLVIARLAHWQLFGPPLEAQAVAANPADIMRGRIVDRSGTLLATDSYAGEIYASPQKIRAAGRVRDSVMISLTHTLRVPLDILRTAMDSDPSLMILSKEATAEQCKQIVNMNQPDLVWCDLKNVRVYPQGAVAAHLLGFTNFAREGVYGVEAAYDAWLRSDGDWKPAGYPSHPQPVPDAWKLYLPSAVGHDLVLNIDAPLQYMAERRLAEAVSYYRAEAGTIIIMDPRTGAVLADANYPSFDPGQYSAVDQDTWVNPAISQIYEPGSVMKLVTMAAGLDSGQITPETPFYDDGFIKVGPQTIKNAEGKSYGDVTAREALAKSVNVVSAKVSLALGADTFYRYVRQFGFGRVTEIDLRMELPGIVKEPGSTFWSPFDLATNSFGQGISVTAFQMAQAVSAIANRGVIMQPELARGFVANGQFYALPPRAMGRPIRPDTAKALTEMMIYTIESSSQSTPVPGYRVAGKTGTAEIPTKEGYTSEEVITSYVGFLPAAEPQLTFLVKLVKPKRYRWAEQVVVPVFSQVAQDAVQILQIRPDDRMP